MDTRRTNIKAVLQIVAAAVLFSTGGAAIKTAAFSGLQMASLRSSIAALTLLLWLGGCVTWSGPVFGVGAIYAAVLTLFVASTKLTTSANAIFLQSTAPLYIAVLAPFLLGERFRRRDLGFLAAVAAGLGICLAGSVEATVTAPDPATGNLLAVICGLTWALTLIGLRWSEQRHPGTAISAVVAGNLIAFAVGLPVLWPLPAASAADWMTLGYLGVFQIACAYILLTRAVGHLPALHVSLLLLLEPVLNPMWTWLARGENPGAWTLVGGAIIIAATAGQAVYDTRTPAIATKSTKTG